MKNRLISIILMCYALIGCAQNSNRAGMDSESRLGGEYADYIEYIDSLRWITGGPEYSTEDIDPKAVRGTWERFSDLYRKERHEAAYDYLSDRSRYGDILVYLRNSTAQYVFVSEVWSDCVAAHAKDEKEFLDEIEKDYSLVLVMTRGVVEFGGEDPYVPPHYMDLVMEYGDIIMAMKNYERAETYDEEIYFAAKSAYGDELMARFLGLTFRCPYLCVTGNEKQAHEELDSFRKRARKECSGEELEKLLAAIDAAEEHMTKDIPEI